MLAPARPAIEGGWAEASAATSRKADIGSKIDAAIAPRLAAAAGLPHEVRVAGPAAEAHQGDLVRAFLRVGEATAGPVHRAAARADRDGRAGDPSQLHLTGMAGETARAFYWQGRTPTPDDVAPRALARRVGMPLLPEVVAAAEAWLAGLPPAVRAVPADVLDLLYVEQRLGCWDAPSRYLFPGAGRYTLSLLATTLATEVMLRLPPEVRLAGTFQEEVVRRAWPVLASLPYNRAVGFQRVTLTVERAVGSRRGCAAGRRSRRRRCCPSDGPRRIITDCKRLAVVVHTSPCARSTSFAQDRPPPSRG